MDAIEEHENEKADVEKERNEERINSKEAAEMIEQENEFYEKSEKTMSKLSSDKGVLFLYFVFNLTPFLFFSFFYFIFSFLLSLFISLINEKKHYMNRI